jgi:ADP-ribose pyrophosphatase
MMNTEYEGKWIRVVKRNNWEFVERTNNTGIVAIVPITDMNNLVLVKQWREPVQSTVVEIPAGLVGDIDKDESAITAARRELLEETGYYAHNLEELGTFPISPGLSNEQLTYVIATKLEKRDAGGGDETEKIETFEIPVGMAATKLMEMSKEKDLQVDAKIFASLMFAYKVVAERTKAALDAREEAKKSK